MVPTDIDVEIATKMGNGPNGRNSFALEQQHLSIEKKKKKNTAKFRATKFIRSIHSFMAPLHYWQNGILNIAGYPAKYVS